MGLKTVKFGGGTLGAGGVLGGLIVPSLGENRVKREGPRAGVDILTSSSRSLKNNSFSNFALPELMHLTLEGDEVAFVVFLF